MMNDAAVDTAKLAADAVTAPSILNGTITGAKIFGGTVDTGKIKKTSAAAARCVR